MKAAVRAAAFILEEVTLSARCMNQVLFVDYPFSSSSLAACLEVT